MTQEHQIGAQLGVLSNLMKRQMAAPLAERFAHVTGTQAMIILYLARAEGERFQKDIEKQFRFRRSTATGILQLMERHGLLRREPVPQDGRLKRLVLTDQARALDAELTQRLRQTEERLRRGIGEEELAVWFRVCGKLRANLETDPRTSSEEAQI